MGGLGGVGGGDGEVGGDGGDGGGGGCGDGDGGSGGGEGLGGGEGGNGGWGPTILTFAYHGTRPVEPARYAIFSHTMVFQSFCTCKQSPSSSHIP